ncbi:MAG TPA: FAD-dependent oxidoreductase, partial [Calditrichia bacterium]|nr:FAD-dependent oxidoreductase [Calditrichia bacterium]
LEAMREDRLPVSPYFGPEGEGLLFPTDGSFNPWLRCRLLTGQVIALGANLYENTPALSVAPGKVVTPTGTVRCREVVVAVDGGLEVLMPALKGRVRTARLQMLATAPAPEVDFPRPVYARYGLEYWQQLPDGRIALGGFRDKGGDGEWGNLSQPSPQIQAMLDKFLRETLGVEAPVTHRWAAPVGFTENGLPVMEALEKGLWVMGGYCGTGNVIGAICGRTIAGLILDAFHSS